MLAGKLPPWLDHIKADLMYMIAPEWVLAAVLYLLFCVIQQKTKRNRQRIMEGGLS